MYIVGAGNIYFDMRALTINYQVGDLEGIQKILEGIQKILYMLNGRLSTPKIHNVNKFIKFLNYTKSVNMAPLIPSANVIRNTRGLSRDERLKGDLRQNAWFSGFFAGDGCFTIEIAELPAIARELNLSVYSLLIN